MCRPLPCRGRIQSSSIRTSPASAGRSASPFGTRDPREVRADGRAFSEGNSSNVLIQGTGHSSIGFCFLLLLSGCGGIAESDEFVEVHDEEQIGISWEDYRDQAEVSVNGKVAYVVEDDLFFDSEADLYAY